MEINWLILMIAFLGVAYATWRMSTGMGTRVTIKKKASVEVITDLDAIVNDSIHFRYKGRIHEIKPISLEAFLKFTQANTAFLANMGGEKDITPDQLVNEYQSLISSVCSTITRQDIEDAEHAQLAALYQLIVDAVTGQVDKGDGKKKRVRLPIYEYAEQSSSLNVQTATVGP